MRTSLVLALLAALAVGAALAEDAGPKKAPAVGDPAPGFRLNDHSGKAYRLADAHDGAWVVLAFYPKADTPGWAHEVCSLRDAATDLDALGVTIVGISLDDVASQKKFAEKHELPYRLVSDPDASAAVAFGAAKAGSAYARRVTFVIDPEGRIRHVDTKVDVRSHGPAMVEVVKKLQETAAKR